MSHLLQNIFFPHLFHFILSHTSFHTFSYLAPQPPPSKPHFTSRLEPEQNLQSGEPLALKCKVGGYPPPKITWFKDGAPLKNELPYEISNRGGESLLTIPQTEEEDGGVYTCQASNPSGQETSSSNVSVSGLLDERKFSII